MCDACAPRCRGSLRGLRGTAAHKYVEPRAPMCCVSIPLSARHVHITRSGDVLLKLFPVLRALVFCRAASLI